MEELQLSIQNAVEQRGLFYSISSLYVIEKRVFDLLASILAMVVLSPFVLLIALLIKLDSKGPVLFVQERNGFKGKVFRMYKFRSMVTCAEDMIKDIEEKNEVKGHMFKIRDDPRITKLGRFLRRTSIDELPQLFNIIKGDMSIVGPRPPILREVVKYDAWHKLRLSVKPGLTGLWQIRGRNEVGFEEMVRLDLKYIRERKFLYDMKIILKTVPVLFGDRRAF